MPTTGPPAAAWSATAAITGREAGDGAGAQVVAVGEAARDDDRVDAADGAVAVPEQLGVATEVADRLERVLLAVRAREQHDADPRHDADLLPGADRHLGVLDHRVGEEAGAHVLDLGAGGASSAASRPKRMDLPTRTPCHAVEAEVGQRPLDGLPLRVGHALPQTDLDLHVELHGPHSRTPLRAAPGVPFPR